MLRLVSRALPADALDLLRDYQTEIDGEPDFAKRVALAKKRFASRNRPRNVAFRAVREALDSMCTGARRCGYCEDGVADEVEHVKPKDLYPGLCFVWKNYLYACGPCNGPKSNRFAVFTASHGINYVEVKPPVVASPRGKPLLIDPRREDPLDFLVLDILGTFRFDERATAGTRDYERARYTIDLLGLNERDYLVQARRTAYGSMRALLFKYATRREEGASASELASIRTDLMAQAHATVWAEMKRHRAAVPELADLFAWVPEALGWRFRRGVRA